MKDVDVDAPTFVSSIRCYISALPVLKEEKIPTFIITRFTRDVIASGELPPDWKTDYTQLVALTCKLLINHYSNKYDCFSEGPRSIPVSPALERDADDARRQREPTPDRDAAVYSDD